MSSFRLGQKEIISSLLSSRDVLAVMPTGGGKSLCYQLPSVLKPGITIVVSPLIALMNDQVVALRSLGIDAGCIHSGMSIAERKQVFQKMAGSDSFLLYLSPERIQNPGFAPWLKKQKVSLFAIDEAHCVSQWGHDFRLEYGQLSCLRDVHPEVPMIGLTATATPIVKRDIIKQLGLKQPVEHVYGFYRPNLYYQVEFCEDEYEKEAFVLGALSQFTDGRAIIYCGTRKKTEGWAELLKAHGYSVEFYHAGLSAQERVKVEKEYREGKIKILTATNAFGMGVDHPDIRLVVHTQMPGNIESYYQEIGRAGRDGLPATCLLAYAKKDKGLQSFFITQSTADRRIKTQRWSALGAMIQYAEGSECRHGDILTYFKDQKRISRCGHCDSCDSNSERRVIPTKVAQPPMFKKKKRKKDLILIEEMNDEQKWRMELIREWRREYAKENDMPAFMVFSDKTLRDLALKAPDSKESLVEVYGLGEKKINTFGEVLLKKLHP